MLKYKNHTYFFITSTFILLIGMVSSFISEDNTLDINVHDTYYVISTWHITYILLIIYSFLGMLYYLINRLRLKTNRTLSGIHTLITCGSIFIYWILYPLLSYLDTSILSIGYVNIMLTILFLLVIVIQLLFIINIFIGLIKIKKQ